jgi:glycosyltransferase involved in cell wall biosynthesis
VGFVLNFKDDGWLGGIHYFQNLIHAVYSNPDRNIELVIFTGNKCHQAVFKNLPDIEIITNHFFDDFHPCWIARQVLKKIFHRDILLEQLLKKNDIVILSHSGSLGEKSKIPTIGWLPDFQHKYLPEFFSGKEIHTRDRKFQVTCKECTCVIFSSNAAKKDAETFYPPHAGKYRVLHFVPSNMDVDSLPAFESLKKKYPINSPYFIVPNQFWIHKNHSVILEALNILKSRKMQICILATGNISDYRQPEYFRTIQKKITDYNLSESFNVLGIVPYKDLLQLMIHSIAVVNPSRFEGWSTSVEEAKVLGLTIILSDIPVHREQNPQYGIFFPPDDPQKLADILSKFQQDFITCPATNPVRNNEKNIEQKKVFAQEYEKIVFDALLMGR